MKKPLFLIAIFVIFGVKARAQTTPPPIDSSVITHQPTTDPTNEKDTSIYSSVDHQAEFPGGTKKFYSFIVNKINGRKCLSGTVLITFIVEIDGHLSNIKIFRGAGKECDDEVIRAFQKSPLWTPAQKSGRAVKTRYTVPINFNR